MRLLQVPPLLPEQTVDAPADFPRLPLGLALLSAQLVRAPPPFLWVRFGPRASRAPSRVSSSRRGRGRGRGWGRGLARAPRERFRARAKGILRIPEEQRSQAGAQTHVGAVRGRLASGSGRGPSPKAGRDCTRTWGGVAAGRNQGPRPFTAQKGHFAFSAGRRGRRLPGLEIT